MVSVAIDVFFMSELPVDVERSKEDPVEVILDVQNYLLSFLRWAYLEGTLFVLVPQLSGLGFLFSRSPVVSSPLWLSEYLAADLTQCSSSHDHEK